MGQITNTSSNSYRIQVHNPDRQLIVDTKESIMHKMAKKVAFCTTAPFVALYNFFETLFSTIFSCCWIRSATVDTKKNKQQTLDIPRQRTELCESRPKPENISEISPHIKETDKTLNKEWKQIMDDVVKEVGASWKVFVGPKFSKKDPEAQSTSEQKTSDNTKSEKEKQLDQIREDLLSPPKHIINRRSSQTDIEGPRFSDDSDLRPRTTDDLSNTGQDLLLQAELLKQMPKGFAKKLSNSSTKKTPGENGNKPQTPKGSSSQSPLYDANTAQRSVMTEALRQLRSFQQTGSITTSQPIPTQDDEQNPTSESNPVKEKTSTTETSAPQNAEKRKPIVAPTSQW